jgi:hypothetical protein
VLVEDARWDGALFTSARNVTFAPLGISKDAETYATEMNRPNRKNAKKHRKECRAQGCDCGGS